MSRGFKAFLLVLLALFLLLFFEVGLGVPFEAFTALLFGWVSFVSGVLPKIRFNPAGVGLAAVCVGLAVWLGQRFCSWLWKGAGNEEPWSIRWTVAGLSAVLLLFAAGMAFTGVAHQVGWLLRSPVPLTRGSGLNQRNAGATLKSVATAQADFRGNDRDGNRIQDFWRGDIAALYFLKSEGSDVPIRLIDISVAGADAQPIRPLEGVQPTPKAGYWYRALRFKDEKEPDPNRFAALAYPDSKSAGQNMFVISHEYTLYKKAFEPGVVPEVYPDDPLKEGWSKVD